MGLGTSSWSGFFPLPRGLVGGLPCTLEWRAAAPLSGVPPLVVENHAACAGVTVRSGHRRGDPHRGGRCIFSVCLGPAGSRARVARRL